MIGWVYVMSPTDYAAWLAGGEKSESMAQQGERLFNHSAAATCHVAGWHGRGRRWRESTASRRRLPSGETRVVDETLIRQAI